MNKLITRHELHEAMQENIITAAQLVGAYRVHFRPFENTLTDTEQDLYKQIMHPTNDEVSGQADDLQVFAECLYSTVYKGVRWYFETPEKLKEFCDVLERW